jgi:hypothetical protein
MTPPAAAVAETLPRHRRAPRRAPVRHPRRVSGPARPARPAAPARSAPRVAAGAAAPGLALRAIGAYERVCDSSLLDRLVRGRVWIGLLAFALIGIVAMQLMVLRLNTGIGATLERAAALQRANAQLGIEAATGSGEGRIEPLAAATGMTFAPSGSVHFVASSPAADVRAAAAALAAPIQPHEGAVAGSEGTAGSSEAQTGTGEAGGESSASSGETGAGESGQGAGEATSSRSSAGESSSAGSAGEAVASSETSASSEGRGGEASAAAAGEPEASASVAGGVASGH